MATTKFLEPGGDATFNAAVTTNGGFWAAVNATPSVVTDFVHGNHIKSIKYRPTAGDALDADVLADAGRRISIYVYIVALPTSIAEIFGVNTGTVGSGTVILCRISPLGRLQLDISGAPLATGATLSTGTWYRLSLAYTITSTSVNRFELFLNGASTISLTNASLIRTASRYLNIGTLDGDATFELRTSDHYVDDSNSLTDTGNVWVTAKRPNANGTSNGFTTRIGAGGSGYGTGHSPQVNERALSTTNGWSIVGAGSAVIEEYNIESSATGDIDISTATIVDYAGWVYTSALVGETTNIILNGVSLAQAITSTNTTYTKFAGSSTYPAGIGADIGLQTDTSLTTVSLFEAGVIVAHIPASAAPTLKGTTMSTMGVG